MSIRLCLILLILVADISDTLLLPFYPQFFDKVFGLNSPQHVGAYIAACCFVVMFSFPLWAKVAKYINELHLWLYTQMISAVLAIGCFYTESITAFWVLSLLMLFFKASYLLVYPYIIKQEEKDKHLAMVGLFAVILHFGSIAGAFFGGIILTSDNPQTAFLVMASTDVIQTVICLYLIRLGAVSWRPNIEKMVEVSTKESTCLSTETSTGINTENGGEVTAITAHNEADVSKPTFLPSYIIKLGVITLLVYMSAFLIRPFFAVYWQSVSLSDNEILSSLIYSITAWAALVGLWYNHRQQKKSAQTSHKKIIILSLFLCIIGLFLQGVEHTGSIIIGRCLFGWGMFQTTVHLQTLLFSLSQPAHYNRDYSNIHFFQNIGLLLSAFAVGTLVEYTSIHTSFTFAVVGFALTVSLFYLLFIFNTRQSKKWIGVNNV
jgi:DHA1 family multidrug resistance protein-like MFS transporter